MTTRLPVTKTFKLFIGGAFPRSESGRSLPVTDAAGRTVAHIAHASRKDLRDAVEAARAALAKWSGATPYNRAQILYRMAEMLEGKRDELAAALEIGAKGQRGKGAKGRNAATPARSLPAIDEVTAAIDRLICFAGWADKYSQVLGCQNPVAGPYYNFTTPEPAGVVGILAPDAPALLGLISLMAPPLCAGNTIVALASESNPIPAAILAEALATSDLPAGTVNILTGRREELLTHFASHRDIDAIHVAGLTPAQSKTLREGVAENLKTVVVREPAPHWSDHAACSGPEWIEPFIDFKTIWHPSAT